MHALRSIVFFASIVLLTLSSCRPDQLEPGDPLVYIPQQAASITAIDMGQLMDKADFDQLKQMDFYREILNEVRRENSAFAQIMEDPYRSGINLDQNMYLSIELDKEGEQGFSALVFALSDKNAFERTLDELDLQYLPASAEPGFLQEKGTALIWNEEVGILGIGPEATIQQQTAAYLSTTADKSISNNDNLRAALAEDFDVLNWVSSEAFVDLFDLTEIGKAARYSEEDLKENYLQSFLRFEEGQMRGETRYHLSRKLAADLALVIDDEVETDFSGKMPDDKLLFYTNIGIRPAGINQLLIEYHIKGMSDQPFKGVGLETDDLIQAFSGDMAVGIYQDTGQGFVFPHLLLALDIDSREHLDRLLEAGKNTGRIRRLSADRYQLLSSISDTANNAQPKTEMEILITDELVYFSGQEELLAAIQGGELDGGAGLPERVEALTAKQAMAAVIDVARLSRTGDDFKDMPISTVEAVGGRKHTTVTVKMKDGEMNSLKQFFQWMNERFVEEEQARSSSDDEKS